MTIDHHIGFLYIFAAFRDCRDVFVARETGDWLHE